MTFSEKTILAVDDDPDFTFLLRTILRQEGCAMESVESGHEALRVLTTPGKSFSLVLLDLNMQVLDGFAICQRIRYVSEIPIIVVTGRTSESDVVRGLESGADDYVVKPFSANEFVARVRAVLRRAGPSSGPNDPYTIYRSGDLTIDFSRMQVTVGDRIILLSGTEYRLLTCLARNAGRVLTPNQILQRVWGPEYFGETHLLRVTMGRLRQRLGDDPRTPRFIMTRQGLGYLMSSPDIQIEATAGYGSGEREQTNSAVSRKRRPLDSDRSRSDRALNRENSARSLQMAS